MLESLIESEKQRIEKEAEIKIKQIDFVVEQFNEHKEFFKEHMEKNNLSVEKVYHILQDMIKKLSTGTYLKAPEEINYRMKDASDHIFVKSGYFNIVCGTGSDPEELIPGCNLQPTEKGMKIRDRYKSLSA